MESILQDFSEAALIRAVKDNLAEFLLLCAQGAGELLEVDSGIQGWYTGVPHPWFNGIIARRFPTEQDHLAVRETLSFFNAHQMSMFTWWNDPALPANSWNKLLLESGFSFETGAPGMAVDLEDLPAPAPVSDHFKIQQVTDLELLKTWVAVFVQGYPIPEDWSQQFLNCLVGLGVDRSARHYLGYLDGTPVTTASVFLGAGVAGIYNIATLPEARGRGLGTAMTLDPLLKARQLGYRIGILQSSDMGYRVYQRLGFQQVCTVDHYFWTSPEADSQGQPS